MVFEANKAAAAAALKSMTSRKKESPYIGDDSIMLSPNSKSATGKKYKKSERMKEKEREREKLKAKERNDKLEYKKN